MDYIFDKFKALPEDKQRKLLSKMLNTQAVMPPRQNPYELTLMSDFTEEAEKRIKLWGMVQGLHSGYQSIDALTKGMVGGELVVVAGKTSQGKTTLAMNIANRVALRNNRVLFVTLEMTHAELTSRFMFINGGNNEDYQNVSTNVAFQRRDELDWKAIDGLIQKAKIELSVDLVIIDHLHYFTRELDNVAEDLGRITKELKKNAIRHNLPIVLISHVRKTKDAATMDDLRSSSYIAQDADIVLMVGRYEDNMLYVKIEKNRNRGFNTANEADLAWLKFDQTKLTERQDAERFNVGSIFPKKGHV